MRLSLLNKLEKFLNIFLKSKKRYSKCYIINLCLNTNLWNSKGKSHSSCFSSEIGNKMYCVIIELKGILYNNINVKKEKNY